MPRGGSRVGAGRPKGQGKYTEPTKPVRIPVSMVEKVLSFVNLDCYQLPLYSSKVQAGFPSPADDHVDEFLDLNQHLVKHPASTFFVKVSGDSMLNAGIHPGDILVVDKSLSPVNGKIVIAVINGDLTVKRLIKNSLGIFLYPENQKFKPIKVTENTLIWGVVTNVLHAV